MISGKSNVLILIGLVLVVAVGGIAWHFLTTPSPPKVLIIGIDGATWSVIESLRAEGDLPNLNRLIEGGSRGRLQSFDAEISPSIWTTIATGKPKSEHGIEGFFVRNAKGERERMVTSVDRKTASLWEILHRNGVRPGFIGWWASWPAEAVGDGYVVTDHLTYSRTRLSESSFAHYTTEVENTYPESLAETITPLVALPKQITEHDIRRFMDIDDKLVQEIKITNYRGDFIGTRDSMSEFKYTLQSDRSYAAIAERMLQTHEVDVMGVYLQGIDVMEHSFWSEYADLPAGRATHDELKRVIPEYYRFTDELIGRLLKHVDESTTVIVLSDHGFATVENTRPDAKGQLFGWHDPQGIFIINGPGIQAGGDLGLIDALDVTPTVLALAGVAQGNDMKGDVIVKAFDMDGIRKLNLRRVESYDIGRTVRTDLPASGIDDDARKRLEGLGYMSGPDDGGG